MIVVQFYSFYRYISSDTFLSTLNRKIESESSCGISLQSIRVPFLNTNDTPPALPADLKQVLIEALQLRHGYDAQRVRKRDPNDTQIPEMELRLRTCLQKHQLLIESWTISLAGSQSVFVSGLRSSLESLEKTTHSNFHGVDDELLMKLRMIKLASIDVHRSSIENLLRTIDVTKGSIFDFAVENKKEFIVKTHVTMSVALVDGTTDVNKAKVLYEQFSDLQGQHVELTVTRFLWSATHAALEVEIGSHTVEASVQVPKCENTFPHITVWCMTGHHAVQSNDLPQLLRDGQAQCVDFEHDNLDHDHDQNNNTNKLIGTISFWDHSNQIVKL
jgi:hypothetical protein